MLKIIKETKLRKSLTKGYSIVENIIKNCLFKSPIK